MTDKQIAAIAREYAEEVYRNAHKEMEVLSNCLSNEAINMFAENMERKLKWLLRRFALVEKENIKKYFQSRNYILSHQDKYEVYVVRESEVEMKLLRCLFPEIAKEVQK